MSEPTCTESAPCFACARCVRTMANVLRDDPNVRAHMTGVETRPAWRPAWKRAAEAGGSLRGDGAEGTITIKAEAGTVHIDRPHIATLPTGERVDLPAGTVLREGTLPPEAEDDRPTLGEQLHDEHNHKLAAEEEIARKAAQIGPASYDRARGRISFKPVEVVEAPGVTQTEIDARTAAEMMRPLYEGAGLPHVAADAVPPAERGGGAMTAPTWAMVAAARAEGTALDLDTCPECNQPYDGAACVHSEGCQLGAWEAEDQEWYAEEPIR